MKKFTYERFRWLFDVAESAVAKDRLSRHEDLVLTATKADGSHMFSWDRDRRVWQSAITQTADGDELVPFIKRRMCLNQLIDDCAVDFKPRFIRLSCDGEVEIHPAIYYATAIADLLIDGDNVRFDRQSFERAVSEWVEQNGY